MRIPGRFQVERSYQTGGVLTGLSQRSDDIQSSIRKEIRVLSMVLQIAVHEVFSRPLRGLERFASHNNIP